jgi:hypothetical protein
LWENVFEQRQLVVRREHHHGVIGTVFNVVTREFAAVLVELVDRRVGSPTMARISSLVRPRLSLPARRKVIVSLAVAGACGCLTTLATAQALAVGNDWAGAVRCDIKATAQGYLHEERQTWTLTGAAPTVQGSMVVFPATWTVTGHGTHDRTGQTSRRVAEWTATVTGANAPIAFMAAPVTGQVNVQLWHSQMSSPGGYTGPDQYINAGVPQPPGRLVATLYEWQFPRITAEPKSTRISGSTTYEVKAQVGPLQPLAESQVTIACAWELGRGTANPLPASPAAPGQSSGSTSSNSPSTNPTASTPPAVTSGAGAAPPTNSTANAGPVSAPNAPNSSFPRTPNGGGLTAIPPTNPATGPIATPVDPANFTATQTADGTVQLTWSAVPGAGSYVIGGPGTNVGVTVNGTSYTLNGLPPGAHTWTIATNYSPGGVLTTADKWSRATATVVNRSARYRVVINGFRVNSETNAGTFGEHNAVFAAAAVEVLDRRNNFSVLQNAAVVQSQVHGDVNKGPTRVRAGSASSSGGFLAGDMFPAGQNPAALSLPPSTTTFPFLLWEGQITDGVEAVVVRPSLWVWNSRFDVFNRWQRLATSSVAVAFVDGGSKTARDLLMDSVRDRAGRGDLSPFRNESRAFFACFSDVIPGGAGLESEQCAPGYSHRPIGLRPTPGSPQYNGWLDVAIVVTREGIERALSSTGQVGGAANGVVPIGLVDNGSNWAGNYDLYLKVERVP